MTWKTLAAVVLGLGLVAAAGCDTKKDAGGPKADGKNKDDDHEHGDGPHGGIVFDVGGGKWHVEFKPDHDKKEATVWILGADEKTPAPVKADKVVVSIDNIDPKFTAELFPTDKGADGSASTFTGKHDGFGKVQEYKGSIRFNVGEKQYSGDFEEKPGKK